MCRWKLIYNLTKFWIDYYAKTKFIQTLIIRINIEYLEDRCFKEGLSKNEFMFTEE